MALPAMPAMIASAGLILPKAAKHSGHGHLRHSILNTIQRSPALTDSDRFCPWMCVG